MDSLLSLDELKGIELMSVDRDSLVDIGDVVIDRNLPQEERIADFIRQIRNPYLYKCGKVIVKVTFADTSETLEDRLESYFASLQ